MYNYKELLDWKYQGCNYNITDAYDYDTLVWNDSTEKPTKESLEIKIDSLKNSRLVTIQSMRAKAYPSVVDQLDILYHGGYDAWKATIQQVKDTYPKE